MTPVVWIVIGPFVITAAWIVWLSRTSVQDFERSYRDHLDQIQVIDQIRNHTQAIQRIEDRVNDLSAYHRQEIAAVPVGEADAEIASLFAAPPLRLSSFKLRCVHCGGLSDYSDEIAFTSKFRSVWVSVRMPGYACPNCYHGSIHASQVSKFERRAAAVLAGAEPRQAMPRQIVIRDDSAT